MILGDVANGHSKNIQKLYWEVLDSSVGQKSNMTAAEEFVFPTSSTWVNI